MSGFERVVTARSVEDAARAVVEVLGAGTAVWSSIEDADRELVAGQPPAADTDTAVEADTAAVTSVCQTTIEVSGGASRVLRDACAALLADVVDRLAIEERGRASRRQLADNERIGGLGSYAWSAADDALEWTDGLYRIYGYDPGGIEPTYQRFVDHVHPGDRDRVRSVHERALTTGEPFEIEERIVRPDGQIRTLWSVGEVTRGDGGRPNGMVGVCRDLTEQREAERRVADADLRRRQALELNDNVIQGLVTLLWRLDGGSAAVTGDVMDDVVGDGNVEAREQTRRVAEATLGAARQMVTDLLQGADTPENGELVRLTPAALEPDADPDTHAGANIDRSDLPVPVEATPPSLPHGHLGVTTRQVTVLIADDLPALRMLIRLRLSEEELIEVVGEAGDGQQVCDLVEQLHPDVVVMDLSMPILDGLQATRRIRERSPETRVIVLSGYPAASMEEQARAAGAECYVEKSSNLDALCEAITAHRSGDLRP